MKKPIMIQTVVLLAVTLLLACQLGMMPHGMGKIRVQCVVPDELTGLAGKTGAKGLIGPPSGYRLASYRLTFTADNGEVVTKTLSRGSGEVTLKVGGWTCLAEGLTADGAVIVEKTLHISTEPGKTLDLAVPLHLAKGKGSLQIAFSPSQAPSVEWKYAVSLVYRGLPGRFIVSGTTRVFDRDSCNRDRTQRGGSRFRILQPRHTAKGCHVGNDCGHDDDCPRLARAELHRRMPHYTLRPIGHHFSHCAQS